MISGLSKARTLEYLRDKSGEFVIPEFLYFGAGDFARREAEILARIEQVFNGRRLIVRSSAADEDGHQFAMAGEYESVPNVPSGDPEAVAKAIAEVLSSYRRKGRNSDDDEFIVQEMLTETSMSGVVFTHDLNSGAPYLVINYDDISGMTDTVTSGGGEYANRTLYIHRGSIGAVRSTRFRRLLAAIQELERVMQSQFLDIEFALAADFTPYLLQVRAITTQPNWNRAIGERIDSALQGIQSFVKRRLEPIPGVYGRTTVLGQMPDWNPAEMIGRAPRALAYSLYKCLITDHAWRIARENMGYAVPTGQPLMVSLAGQPFIDTRLSFHSFLPAGLEDQIAHKLVDAWVARLRAQPELHDKIEFDVAITTYSFDFGRRTAGLREAGLSDSEIQRFRDLSRRQTVELLADSGKGGISQALAAIERLAHKQRQLDSTASMPVLTALAGMIDDCIRFGTVPFSILARHGFIAQTLLQSLRASGIIDDADVAEFQTSIRTVASDLVDDLRRMQSGELSRDEVMARYGHLRPGTYDILSQRYDQIPDFGSGGGTGLSRHDEPAFTLDPQKRSRIDQLLREEGFDGMNSEGLLKYIGEATSGREFGKFVFTRSVSDMLELIANFGEAHGVSRDEMSHIPIDELLGLASQSGEGAIEDRMRRIARERAEKHELCRAIRLPQILFDEAGVHVVPFQVSHPNFITGKKITAACTYLRNEGTPPALEGNIVLIENADPGFDWIFSQNIGGLITKYGGANSHMAIRCAEFGIPAAIGCGEQRFESLTGAEKIQMDCAAGLISILH